ncbi:MAG: ABC transporter ATP-binding protein [Anaerolineae bacterium]|nr:ABC transporter ATP-binding protein [Anaerolineae bacterium]
MIQVKRVFKSYGYRKVLNDLNFCMMPGEIVALIGSNGAGKTTLIRLLCGLNKPDAGSIQIDGMPLLKSNAALRARLGVVLHTSMLYNHLTCRENLEFYGKLYGLPSARQRINELLLLVGLEARADDKVGTFSRGMQQRLSVARALLHDPTFLLMDEVFNGLDQRYISQFVDVFQKQAALGKGILFSTHDLEKVFSIATRVDILNRGCIVFSEPVKELTRQSLMEVYQEKTGEGLIADLKSTRRQP